MQKELIGQATPEQIAEWKSKHKKVIAIKAGGHVIYLRKPEWADYNIAATQTDTDSPYDYNRTIMRETKLGGSDEIIDNPQIFFNANRAFNKHLDGDKAELEEL